MHVHEGQADAHCHRVDAGGKAGQRKLPEAVVLRRIFFFPGTVRAQAVVDHVDAQRAEQAEGDPVVEGFDVLQGGTAEQPADDGRDRFDDAEDDAGAQRIAEHRLAHGGTLADRRSEGIGGHGEADQEDRNRRHGGSGRSG
ncbi:hypothetical protein G6F65_019045 [Rhizopus arrhizus]|nr:hypothetical protein G6F65_019045 [Rhizopus arrhizus]